MNNSIHTAMKAACKILEKQEVTNNNLSNISTPGFKSKFLLFLSDDSQTKNDYKLKKNCIEFYDMSPGSFTYTHRPLDLIIKNNGWFIVNDRKNNKKYFTRNGHVNINRKGILNIQGKYLLGQKGNILIPNNVNINITRDGDVIGTQVTNNNIKNFKIDKLKIAKININNMKQYKNGMFIINNKLKKHVCFYKKNPIIKSKMIETSNVNPTKNIIDMITDARMFEINMKIISHADEMENMANRMINVNT